MFEYFENFRDNFILAKSVKTYLWRYQLRLGHLHASVNSKRQSNVISREFYFHELR